MSIVPDNVNQTESVAINCTLAIDQKYVTGSIVLPNRYTPDYQATWVQNLRVLSVVVLIVIAPAPEHYDLLG